VPWLAILPAILDIGISLRTSAWWLDPVALIPVVVVGLLVFLVTSLVRLKSAQARRDIVVLALCLMLAFTLTHWWIVPGIVTALLTTILILIYGAAVVSLGLAAATWQRRLGRAVTLNVSIYLAVTVFYPAVIIAWSRPGPPDLGIVSASPFFAVYLTTCLLGWPHGIPFGENVVLWGIFMGALMLALAFGLRWTTLASFDRCLGRVSEKPRPRAVRTAIISSRREIMASR
jgi:hypothetical protein